MMDGVVFLHMSSDIVHILQMGKGWQLQGLNPSFCDANKGLNQCILMMLADMVYIVKDLVVFSEVWTSLVPFVGMKEGLALEMWLRELESLELWVVFLDVGLTIFESVLVFCNIGFVAFLLGKSLLGFYQIGMLHHAIQARKSSKVPSILKCTMIHTNMGTLLHLIW